jgi:hypothetical protein
MANRLSEHVVTCLDDFLREEGESANSALFKYVVEHDNVFGLAHRRACEDQVKVAEMTSATEAMHIDGHEDENEDSKGVRDGDFDSEAIIEMLNEEPSQHPLDPLRAIILEATLNVLQRCEMEFDYKHLAMLCKQIPQFAVGFALEGLKSGRLTAERK